MEIPNITEKFRSPFLKKVIFADPEELKIKLDWEKIKREAARAAKAMSYFGSQTETCVIETGKIAQSLINQGVSPERIKIIGVKKSQSVYEHVWPTIDGKIISSKEDQMKYADFFGKGKPVKEPILDNIINRLQTVKKLT